MADEEGIVRVEARVPCQTCGGNDPTCGDCAGSGETIVALTREYLTRWVTGYGLKAVAERWISDWEERP